MLLQQVLVTIIAARTVMLLRLFFLLFFVSRKRVLLVLIFLVLFLILMMEIFLMNPLSFLHFTKENFRVKDILHIAYISIIYGCSVVISRFVVVPVKNDFYQFCLNFPLNQTTSSTIFVAITRQKFKEKLRTRGLEIAQQNIRGLRCNLDSFQEFLTSQNELDIIAGLTETHKGQRHKRISKS